jgi:aldose 1-epimerase
MHIGQDDGMTADACADRPLSHTVRMLGTVPDRPGRPGGEVQAVRLTCRSLSIEVLSLGATLVDVVHDPDGSALPLVSALPHWTEYDNLHLNHFVGSTLGRWCRALKETKVQIEGRSYQLTRDSRGMHAHGGPTGFHYQNWRVSVDVSDPDSLTAVLDLVSPDGHQGYPGEVHAQVAYRMNRTGKLEVSYRATSTKPTLLGMSNHVYWRIGSTPIERLHLGLPAAWRLELVDEVPTLASPIVVKGEHDFQMPRQIGDQEIDTFYIAKPGALWLIGSTAEKVAMQFTSSDAGAGVYTGDHDRVRRRGVCLEFGGWPGAERRPDFPSPVVRQGEVYQASWSLEVVNI